MKRRDFLRNSAAGAGLGLSLFPRSAWSAPFGQFPVGAADAMLPVGVRAKNVLEVFLYGGLSCWESLYLVEEYGVANNQQYHTFGGTGGDSVEAALTACGTPAPTPIGLPFATDSLGASVKIGPFAMPLRARADVLDRMRLVVQRHDLQPHEAAIPLALTGKRVGSPSLAGLGTHIARYQLDQNLTGRAAPYSYLFSTGGLSGDNVLAAAATGLHPGIARPLNIKVDNSARLYELLDRGEVGNPTTERAQYDAALSVYVDRYQQKLRFQGNPLRSARFSNLAQAAVAVSGTDAVKGVLNPADFIPQAATVCGDANPINIPGMSLQIARGLLTHPTEPASYVCVSDTGLIEASGGGGYDTHTENSHDTARNFTNVLTELLAMINGPTEGDPSKIDLNDTLVILNTEFGRTPTRQGGGSGRNHHPYGYVTAFIGGPITAAQKGVVGAIGPDGIATDFAKPSENRIAAMLAMGIWPFSPEAFFVSDVAGVTTEEDAVRSVTARLLGYTL